MSYRPIFAFPRLTPFVKKLIIGLLAAYVLELLLMNFAGIPILEALWLVPADPGVHTLWQLVTYAVVDDPRGVFSHLLGLLFIWLIVSPFESEYGSRRTMQLCLAGILSASAAALLVGLVMPALVAGEALLGSHSIAYAGMAAMAATVRGRRLSLFGLFSMTPNQLLLLLAGISVLVFLASKNVTVLVASLAAIGGGLGFVRWLQQPRGGGRRRRPPRKGPGFRVIDGGRDRDDGPKWLN